MAADWLKPVYEQIRTGVMACGYVQVDETPVNYLDPGHDRTRQGYLWTGSRPKGDVFFRWETKPCHGVPEPRHSRETSPARCNVTATRPIERLPTVAVGPLTCA